MFYAAYFDESFDSGREGIFAVAAVFGDAWTVMKAESMWKEALNRHGFSTFKSSKLKKKPDIVLEFAKIIADSGLLACGIVTRHEAVREHFAKSALHKQYRDSPYMLAHQVLFVGIGLDVQRTGLPVSVALICDKSDQYHDIMRNSLAKLRALNPTASKSIASLSFETDENCIPLQMADLLAGELRKAGDVWDESKTNASPALRMLLDRGVFWAHHNADEESLRKLRALVDQRPPTS